MLPKIATIVFIFKKEKPFKGDTLITYDIRHMSSLFEMTFNFLDVLIHNRFTRKKSQQLLV